MDGEQEMSRIEMAARAEHLPDAEPILYAMLQDPLAVARHLLDLLQQASSRLAS